MAVILPTSRDLPVVVIGEDILSHPRPIVGVPAWSVSDPAMADLAAAPDGLSVVVTPIGALGTVLLTVIVPPQIPGGPELTDSGEIELVAGEAVRVRLVFGEPRPRS